MCVCVFDLKLVESMVAEAADMDGLQYSCLTGEQQ